jgi:hypothetical protein
MGDKMATWRLNPLTTSSNAGSLAAYVFNSQLTQHIIYIDNNDLHVHELWSYGDGKWHPNDLTEASGAPKSSNADTLAAYVFDLGEIRSLGGGLPPTAGGTVAGWLLRNTHRADEVASLEQSWQS